MPQLSAVEKICHVASLVPSGKVASYGQIADLAGLPGRARMVGRAMATNPNDLTIPWHRIMRSNGKIAFAKGSKLAKQQTLFLTEEGIPVINGKVDISLYRWLPDLAFLLHDLDF